MKLLSFAITSLLLDFVKHTFSKLFSFVSTEILFRSYLKPEKAQSNQKHVYIPNSSIEKNNITFCCLTLTRKLIFPGLKWEKRKVTVRS